MFGVSGLSSQHVQAPRMKRTVWSCDGRCDVLFFRGRSVP